MKKGLRLCFATSIWAIVAAAVVVGQGYSPDEAPRRMKVADGFQVKLVASEPLVRQPVAIEFDDRGRLWVIQYLQYPNPAGLKRIKVDRYSRTVYDRVPEPPPRAPRGADRITILLDADGPKPASKGKDFVTGLNLATGIAFGHGGVFVLQVPYLLFYPDRNGDDVPDGDPEVLLSGFGMEDAHSVANSLTWGPDGWLYGCQGSTVTAHFRGKYIAADLLGHAVYWHDLEPWGTTFRSAHGGSLLLANDTWFAPCDVTLGPDGSVYVADWFDKRTAHPDPDADWDRSNGRIYKIEAKGTKSVAPFDLSRLSSDRLVSLLSHRNDWFRRKARQVLADRRDPEVIFPLR